ncbi:MAG: patatin-like phospholipase family protein [Candidatus Thermoplasmatota archaeon]
MTEKDITKVAVACQGGGSHTAFTAGVLKKILREKEKDGEKSFEIVGLSGASGGAISALLAWYGMLQNDSRKSIEMLDAFWDDIAAKSPWDRSINNWSVLYSRMQDWLPTPKLSPYDVPNWGQRYLRKTIEKYVDFHKIDELLDERNPDMYVGTVCVRSGEFKTFKNEEIDSDVLLASAAEPTIFRSVRMRDGIYWDGTFSHNPPLKNFHFGENVTKDSRPDQIWIIHINKDSVEEEPKSIAQIRHRRNSLAGNLSMHQEVDFLKKYSEWIREGYIPHKKFKPCDIKFIKMSRDLDKDSKLDRRKEFIDDLMSYGEEKADEFFDQVEL